MKPKPTKVKMTPFEMQRATEEIMRELGNEIHMALKNYFPGSGFVLLVFPFDKPSVCNYISDAGRDSMIEALKKAATRLEANKDTINPTVLH